MIDTLVNLLSSEDAKSKMLEALTNNVEETISDKDITLHIVPTDKSLQINVEYNDAQQDLVKFYKFVNNIPDDWFVQFCEWLGAEKVKYFSELLDSTNTNKIKEGIQEFYKEFQKFFYLLYKSM